MIIQGRWKWTQREAVIVICVAISVSKVAWEGDFAEAGKIM